MKKLSEFNAFEILGPIMVGPSSSHTAGACKIANIAAKICPGPYEKVTFYLHGSFALTYKGHGTDKALLGGVLGFSTYDKRLRDSFSIAKSEGLNYEFVPTDLGEKYHPNTVKIVFSYKDKEDEYVIGTSIGGRNMVLVNICGIAVNFKGTFPTLLFQYPNTVKIVFSYKDKEDEYVIGTSIGGRNMVLVNICGIAVNFKGTFPTLLFQYPEQKGIIAFVSSTLSFNNYNIESMSTTKNELTDVVTLTVEVSNNIKKKYCY